MIPLPVVDPLDSITIPVNCPVPWEEMHGDRRTRFCDKCSQNVHDVSELTRDEAVQLVTGGEKVPCLRLYRRPDRRVMTADCMTKRERVWKWLHKRSAWAASLFALVFFAGCRNPIECTAGDPLPPPMWSELEGHVEEQSARSAATAEGAQQASTMGAEEKAEAAVRHETHAAR